MNTEQSEICPLRLAMDVVGGKWRLSIICLLKDGKPLRYNQIKRGVPGITKYSEVPVRVEYQLTNNGKTLLDLLEQFSEWGNQYISRHQEYRSHCINCLFRDGEDF